MSKIRPSMATAIADNDREVLMFFMKFSVVLGLMFIFLKLSGDIDWSWWLVLLPLLWPGYAVFFSGAMIFLFIMGIATFEYVAEKLD